MGLCRVPTLLVHGRADDFVQPKHSQALAATCAGPCELVLDRSGTHNSARPARVYATAARFLLRALYGEARAERAAPALVARIEALAAEGRLTTAPWAAKGGDVGVFPSDLDGGGEFESGMSERRQRELETHLMIR